MEPIDSPKSKKKRRWLVPIAMAAIAVGGAGMATYAFNFRQTPKIDLQKYTVRAKVEDLTTRISASGTIVPFQTVNLSPKVGGRIAKLLVEQGDIVQQGQTIAIMESAEAQAEVMRAQANVRQAEANYTKAVNGTRPEEIAQSEANVRLAAAALARARNGNRSQEIEQARARLVQSQTGLQQAQASAPQQVEQGIAQVRAAIARQQLAATKLSRFQALRSAGAISQDRLDEATAEYQTTTANRLEVEQRLQQTRNNSQRDIQQRQAAVYEASQALSQQAAGTRTEEIAQREAELSRAQIALQQLKNGSRREDIAQLQAAVEIARAQLLLAQVQLRENTIVAPFAGTITQRYASEGAFVTPTTTASTSASATSSSIVAIAREIEVRAKVPEVDIGKIQIGQPLEIAADAFPEGQFTGKVRLIAPEAVVEQNVTSFEVRAAIENGRNELKSGMNVNITFLGERQANALMVPTVAIATRRGQTGVFVPDNNSEPRFQVVKIGSTFRDKTQILEGLKPGDMVFTDVPRGFKEKMSQ